MSSKRKNKTSPTPSPGGRTLHDSIVIPNPDDVLVLESDYIAMENMAAEKIREYRGALEGLSNDYDKLGEEYKKLKSQLEAKPNIKVGGQSSSNVLSAEIAAGESLLAKVSARQRYL